MLDFRSKGASILPYNPELWKSNRKMNALEYDAQRLRELGDNPTMDNDGRDELEKEALPQWQCRPALEGQDHRPMYFSYEDDNVDLDGGGTIGAIVLPPRPDGIKLTITSTML